MEHLYGLLDSDLGRVRRKGAALDFVSSFYVQMFGRDVRSGAVAVRYYEGVFAW